MLDLENLVRAVTQHGQVARIVIVDTKGSAPRDAGTSMLVWEQGQSGTIGGGTLEFQAVKAARAMLSESAPWQRFKRAVPLGPALGQCCGGSVTLLSEVFSASETAELRKATNPGKSFNRFMRSGTGPVSNPALTTELFSEPLQPRHQPLWIYGAGHVGRSLVNILSQLDFDITWVDTDMARFPETVPEHVTVLPSQNPSEVVRYAPVEAQHLVLTYSHAHDLEICHKILSHSFHFAGLIGSETKWARFQKRLSVLGHTLAQISRIACPIGDPALGKEPQAIAIGVAAQLLKQAASQVAPLEKETAIDLF